MIEVTPKTTAAMYDRFYKMQEVAEKYNDTELDKFPEDPDRVELSAKSVGFGASGKESTLLVENVPDTEYSKAGVRCEYTVHGGKRSPGVMKLSMEWASTSHYGDTLVVEEMVHDRKGKFTQYTRLVGDQVASHDSKMDRADKFTPDSAKEENKSLARELTGLGRDFPDFLTNSPIQ